MIRRLAALFALAFALAAAPLAGRALAADARPYAARVAEADALVRSFLPRSADATRAHDIAVEVEQLLPESEVVTAATGSVRIDSGVASSLARRLDSATTPAARRDAAELLSAHLASLHAAVPDTGRAPTSDDPAKLRAAIARHRGDVRSDLSQRLGRLIERIGEWLARQMDRVGESRPLSIGARIVFWLVVIAIVLVLVVTLWRVVRRLRAELRGTPERPRPAEDGAPVVAAAEGLPADALAFAEELAAAGRFREAVRALFGGAARRLVERRVVAQTRTRTDAELLAEVVASPAVHAPLSALTALFERAWYGHADPGESGFAEARGRYGEVVSAADASARAAGGEA